jgi:transposase-like protein
MRFQKVQEQAILLTPKEKEKLITILRNSYSLFAEHDKISSCPHCDSTHIVKNGTRSGFHKYICRSCKKNFTFRTKSTIKGIHKVNSWNQFLEDFMSLNITPVRELKKKIGVSEQTIFNWRHKLLAALITKEVKYTDEPVEFDELNFLIRRKGRQELNIPMSKSQYRHWRQHQNSESRHTVKVFATYGRNSGLLDLFQSNMGRTSKDDMKEYFVKDKFRGVTVYCDTHHTYKGFFRDKKIAHQTFISKEHVSRVNPDVHNQTVNSYARGFKTFVNKQLRGVSTKYLVSYLKWYQFLQVTKTRLNQALEAGQKIVYNIKETVCKEIVRDQYGLEIFRRFEFAFGAYLRKNGRTNYGTCKGDYYYGVQVAGVETQMFLPRRKK